MSNAVPAPESVQLYLPGRPFTANELAGMRADGLLRHVYGGCYAPSGRSPGREERAAALFSTLGAGQRHRTILGRMSAAWVYGCAPVPDRPVLLADRARRTTCRPGATVHEVALGPADVLTLAGVRVTAPLRTASDIAYHEDTGPAVAALRRLGADPALDCPLEKVLAVVASRRHTPGREGALRSLHLALQAPPG